METAEPTRQMEQLEQRYFELHRDLRSVRVQLDTGAPDSTSQALLEARVVQREQEMRAILQEIARVEDHLLD